MEQYTFRIQTKPHFYTLNGKSYVRFQGNSVINREDGVRKQSVLVSRTCFCTGNAWQIFKSKKNLDKLYSLDWKKLMIAEANFLDIGRTVVVRGETNELTFGKKGMHVQTIEVINPLQEAMRQELTFTNQGFAEHDLAF